MLEYSVEQNKPFMETTVYENSGVLLNYWQIFIKESHQHAIAIYNCPVIQRLSAVETNMEMIKPFSKGLLFRSGRSEKVPLKNVKAGNSAYRYEVGGGW